MKPEIIAAMVGGGFLLLNTLISSLSALLSKRIAERVDQQGDKLSQTLAETAKINLVQGEKNAHDVLARLTVQEDLRVRVTRFNPRKVQKMKRYFDAVNAKILGLEFEDERLPKVERYNRLTSLNSEDNKRSLVEMVEFYMSRNCDNFILRVTADKNDFELLIFEESRTAAFCFHDMSNQSLLHSCMTTADPELFEKFSELYEKLWNEDIILEIDFSRGREHVVQGLEKLKEMEPVEKVYELSPIDRVIREAELKIAACEVARATH